MRPVDANLRETAKRQTKDLMIFQYWRFNAAFTLAANATFTLSELMQRSYWRLMQRSHWRFNAAFRLSILVGSKMNLELLSGVR